MSDGLYRLQFWFPLFNILKLYPSCTRLEVQGIPLRVGTWHHFMYFWRDNDDGKMCWNGLNWRSSLQLASIAETPSLGRGKNVSGSIRTLWLATKNSGMSSWSGWLQRFNDCETAPKGQSWCGLGFLTMSVCLHALSQSPTLLFPQPHFSYCPVGPWGALLQINHWASICSFFFFHLLLNFPWKEPSLLLRQAGTWDRLLQNLPLGTPLLEQQSTEELYGTKK